jgi:sialate O-acetylesterase
MKPLLLQVSAAFVLSVSLCSAEGPFLSPVFTDHMVLQRDRKDAVWGWAKPGDKVSVTLAGQSAEAVAGAEGKWQVMLPALPAGGPHTMTVSGPETVTLQDILIGDVWICSGQSNMEWKVANSNEAQAEIAAANHPQIRSITLPHVTAPQPQTTFSSDGWQVCSPQTVGEFTAVGYYFGRKLHEDLKVPVGLIHTSWGGTIAEAWASKEGLAPIGDFNAAMAALEELAKVSGANPQEDWFNKHDAGVKEGWSSDVVDDAAWTVSGQPLQWTGSAVAELANLDGVVWFRRSIALAHDFLGKDAVLQLGAIDDDDTVWFNGRQVGTGEGWNKARSYKIPGDLVKLGKNVIAVRVVDHSGGGGIVGPADQMKLVFDTGFQKLEGNWRYKIGADFAKCPPFPRRAGGNPNVPTVLYNAMISPLLPYGIKGAIWYQGESNAGRAQQYRKVLPAMIGDWRKRFGQGDFPFYIVQLANFMQKQPEPGPSEWAELREAQTMTGKNLPNSGIAVTIDIGDAADIHPRNKQDVGKRLALQALAKTYGKEVVAAGPEFKSAKVEGGAIRLGFDSVGGGLVAKDGTLKSFSIAGEDKKFVWAEAKIDGETVVVSSPQVAKPVAVRYGWENNPDATLFNKEGLPAGPFRTDDWPGVTDGRK